MEIAYNAVNPENGGNGQRNKNQENQLQVAWRQCVTRFCNNRGVVNQLWFCNTAQLNEVGSPPPLVAVSEVDNNFNGTDDAVAKQQFFWGNKPGNQLFNSSSWKSVMRILCSGIKICLCYLKHQVAKIAQTKSLGWTMIGSPLREFSMFALQMMLTLLLQKPSKSSKSNHLVVALKWRLDKWKKGEFLQPLPPFKVVY